MTITTIRINKITERRGQLERGHTGKAQIKIGSLGKTSKKIVYKDLDDPNAEDNSVRTAFKSVINYNDI